MKFVVRLLDGRHALLGWAAVEQVSADHGLVRPTEPLTIHVDEAGTIVAYSVHWCDLGVARLVRLAEPVTAGEGVLVTFNDPLWQVVGEADVPLPAVTVRQSVRLSLSTGSLGATGSKG